MPLTNVLNATLCNTGQYIYGCHLLKCINLSDSLFYDLPLSIMEINSKMLTDNLICLLYKISKIQMTRRRGVGGGHTWPSTKTKGTPIPPAPPESAPAKFLQWLWVRRQTWFFITDLHSTMVKFNMHALYGKLVYTTY